MTNPNETIIDGGDLPCVMCGKTAKEQNNCLFWMSQHFSSGICEHCIVAGFSQFMARMIASGRVPITEIKVSAKELGDLMGMPVEGPAPDISIKPDKDENSDANRTGATPKTT